MMRTIEVLIVIIIITGAFIAASFFAVLPWPRQVSPVNLRRLAFTTLQMLDSNYELSRAAFETDNYTIWGGLQVALSAALPPNVIYNLTVYEVTGETMQLYTVIDSMSNAESLGATSDASTYLVASSNVTFNVTPEKIGEHSGGGTLYILNCSDANGWWITGYTAQSLAQDLYNLLSPYFVNTIMVQNTTQLEKILNNNTLQGENIQNAVIINTYGEAVPIPAGYYTTQGYYAPRSSYNKYFYILGQKTRQYNWTWASIVGYPMYYVSNTAYFNGASDQNGWGVYGMRQVGEAGFNAFLRGLSQIDYNATWFDGSQWKQAWWQDIYGNWIYDHGWITSELPSVPLSVNAIYYSNYYGIYPAAYQTATRALPTWITSTYNLTVTASLFDPVSGYRAGAIYRNAVSGGFLALGLTRTPDIRLTALGLLSDFKPRLYNSEYSANGTSRLVVLQLGLVGGV